MNEPKPDAAERLNSAPEGGEVAYVEVTVEDVVTTAWQLEAANARIATLESQLLEASELLGKPIGHGVGILCVAEAVKVVLAQLAEAAKRYESAVSGRRTFRQMYREAQARGKQLGVALEQAAQDAVRLEAERDAAVVAAEKASETSRVALADAERVMAENARLQELLDRTRADFDRDFEEAASGFEAGEARAIAAEARESRLRAALEEIRDGRKPQVCLRFETCMHAGCSASYAAYEIARQALSPDAPAERVTPWQPIETAPRDGTLILLYPKDGDGRISTGAWWKPEGGDACWKAGTGWFEVGEVSHWMPIPDAPAEEKGKGE